MTLNDHKKICNSCTICVISLVTGFVIIIGSISPCFLFYWHLKKAGVNTNSTGVNTNAETVIY